MIEFLILGDFGRRISKTAALDFQRADFDLFRTMIERVPWEVILESMGAQEAVNTSRKLFKGTGADHHHVTEDKLMVKETSLAEQKPLAGTCNKRKNYGL